MSKTFNFHKKLNNYKSLGLALSGGIDSALLLYYLLNQGYKVKCYTLVDKDNDNNIRPAIDVMNLIEEKTGKTIENFEFIKYKKDHKYDKREKITEIYTDLFNSEKIDCLLTGATQYLKNIEDKWNQADKLKSSDTVWTNNIVYRPFLNYDKSWIKKGCDANGLTDDLVKITVSCVSTYSYPCKDCLWCAEKYTVFECY
tara:strand:- start:700 stop:1296 length:597 start_codon:yes stop_codon:yes gene_type:complete